MKRPITIGVIVLIALSTAVSWGEPTLNGQYWFGSLSVDVDTDRPWCKRGSVSITGDQWDQEWEDSDGHHTFSAAFSATLQADGSVDIAFPGETYNVAWNGDVMIHAGSVLGGGGEGVDIFIRKASNIDVNDVLGDYSYFGHYLGPADETALWGTVTLNSDGTASVSWTSDSGTPESDEFDWTLDAATAVIDALVPMGDELGHAAFLLGQGDLALECHITFEEGRDATDLGYNVFVKNTDEPITMADIAGTYQIRFLETGPGAVPYTCGRGTCLIEAVDEVNGILSIDAYYSNGEHDVFSLACSVGPGNEFHLADATLSDGIVGPQQNLILVPQYSYANPPMRTDDDWLGGIFLVRNSSLASPVYRFWSPRNSRHFYTISEAEKDYVEATYPANIWTYETVAYYAFADNEDAGLSPVYRFWSNALGAHFYTISEAERDYVIAHLPAWTYEGPVFYAYPEGSQPVDASPVYRFWSGTLSTHFYTINEAEKDYVINNLPSWEYETIAWHAYD